MKRRKFTNKFKTKVVLEALSGRYTVQELARKHELHANQISRWKAHFLENAEAVFEKESEKDKENDEQEKEKLFKVIGQQKVEIDFLKKPWSEQNGIGSPVKSGSGAPLFKYLASMQAFRDTLIWLVL